MTDLTDKTFEAVFSEKKPMIALFWADWCKLCLDLIDRLSEMETEAADTAYSQTRFVKIDNEANPELSERFNVTVMPTVIAFADGKICDIKIGFREKSEYGEMIHRINN
jgi:thioredoxin 2